MPWVESIFELSKKAGENGTPLANLAAFFDDSGGVGKERESKSRGQRVGGISFLFWYVFVFSISFCGVCMFSESSALIFWCEVCCVFFEKTNH